jgi:hypothetical protein
LEKVDDTKNGNSARKKSTNISPEVRKKANDSTESKQSIISKKIKKSRTLQAILQDVPPKRHRTDSIGNSEISSEKASNFNVK